MHRLVASCFKAIMFSIIFVFVFDMSFYLYRVISLNSRMESIMTSMQKVVMENNYLPDGSYKLYENIFSRLASDMNQGGETFIRGFNINYSHDATLPSGADTLNADIIYANGSSASNVNILKKRMDTPAQYGEVMAVQVIVGVYSPIWGWGSNNTGEYKYTGQNAQQWNRNATGGTVEFTYTYYVPCLKYQSISG